MPGFCGSEHGAAGTGIAKSCVRIHKNDLSSVRSIVHTAEVMRGPVQDMKAVQRSYPFSFLTGFFASWVRHATGRPQVSDGPQTWGIVTGNGHRSQKAYDACGKRDVKLHGRASTLPPAYRLGVICLTALGFAYIWGVVLVLVYLLFSIIQFAFSTPDSFILLVMSSPVLCAALAMLFSTGRTLRVRVKHPDGIELIREDSPELFETVRRMGKTLRAPGIGRIMLSDDFQISIVRVPRFGFPCCHTNCLVLGLPLLQALSGRQMLAVLAHEYGRLSRLGGWLNPLVFRLRQTWLEVLKASEKHRSRWILRCFLRWYAPCFQSFTRPLAQAHELSADLCSVLLVGRSEAAAAFVRSEMLDYYLSECFWPMIWSMADTWSEPPESVYGLMQERLKNGIDEALAQELLQRALSREDCPEDGYQSLKRRIQALNEPPVFHELSDRSAARQIFPNLSDLRKRFDDAWSASVREQWQERHAYMKELKGRAADLVSKARLKNLSVEEAFDLANLTEELSGSDRALPFFERILKYRPGYVPALSAIGRIALAKGDESGAGWIEKALELDPAYRLDGFELLYNYFTEKGDREKAGRYYQLLSERRAMLERLGCTRKQEGVRS